MIARFRNDQPFCATSDPMSPQFYSWALMLFRLLSAQIKWRTTIFPLVTHAQPKSTLYFHDWIAFRLCIFVRLFVCVSVSVSYQVGLLMYKWSYHFLLARVSKRREPENWFNSWSLSAPIHSRFFPIATLHSQCWAKPAVALANKKLLSTNIIKLSSFDRKKHSVYLDTVDDNSTQAAKKGVQKANNSVDSKKTSWNWVILVVDLFDSLLPYVVEQI